MSVSYYETDISVAKVTKIIEHQRFWRIYLRLFLYKMSTIRLSVDTIFLQKFHKLLTDNRFTGMSVS